MKNVWNDNTIQFPRLIAEIESCGGFTSELVIKLANEMDLTIEEVEELISRGQSEFDKIKENIL